MKTLLGVAMLLLAGCASIPGAPKCNDVKYERHGDRFTFQCEGDAGALGGKPL